MNDKNKKSIIKRIAAFFVAIFLIPVFMGICFGFIYSSNFPVILKLFAIVLLLAAIYLLLYLMYFRRKISTKKQFVTLFLSIIALPIIIGTSAGFYRPLGFLALPLLFTGMGVYLLIYQILFSRKASFAEGTITNLVVKRGSVYHHMVQFRPVEAGPEEIVIFQSPFGSKLERYRVGDLVPILYNPTKPSKAYINSQMDRWLLPSLLIAIGTGTTLTILLLISL